MTRVANLVKSDLMLVFGDFNFPEIYYEKVEMGTRMESEAYRFFNKALDLYWMQ